MTMLIETKKLFLFVLSRLYIVNDTFVYFYAIYVIALYKK